jgi:Ni/Fe-hydrogenase 1 B-type cytochrome subunit
MTDSDGMCQVKCIEDSKARLAVKTKLMHVYNVWDIPTNCFHWINAVAVVMLMALGLGIYISAAFDLGNDAKILLKTLHVLVGYVFVSNLLWRLTWAFFGNRHSRWRAFLPYRRGYGRALTDYLRGLWSGQPRVYAGHNPVGRLAITLFFVLLVAQALSGLVLAGTDLYYPPFGAWFAQWVAATGVPAADVAPYRPDLVDAGAYAQIRTIRESFISSHKLGFFAIAALAVIHVVGVIITELREGGALTSAMFTGRKVLDRPAEDADALKGDRNGE